MIASMTGYGRGEYSDQARSIVTEIRSLNHRFLEISIRLPRGYLALEDKIRKFLQSRFHRGHLEVYVSIKDEGEKKRAVKVDKDLALAYYKSVKEIAQILDIQPNIEIDDLLALPEVISLEEIAEDAETLWPLICASLEQAVTQVVDMRFREGQRLVRDIISRTGKIFSNIQEIEKRAPLVVELYRERLRLRMSELLTLDKELIDESRLAQEIVFFTERSDISEEITRLYSHLEQFSSVLNSEAPVGRKLDFLIQEMHREANTIAAKCNDSQIAHRVVELKAELEKLREQIQNIE